MANIKKVLFLVVFLMATMGLNAQKYSPGNYRLTHELTPEEKAKMERSEREFTETDPPTGEVRNIAEWEPMEGVLVTYDYGFGIPYSLIAEMSQDCRVTTLVSGSSEENTVRSYYTSNGVNLDNCDFIYHNADSWWTRDYSPWYIAIDDNEVGIINFPYNRPRPNDNDVPIAVSEQLGVGLYGMDVTHTGGNYMCDGYGAAASTDLVWEEESQSEAQIRQKTEDYLGITNYHVTADPLDEYIKHIDCWGKFLDVDKILITQVPESDYRYEDFEDLADYYASQNCSWGYPYEVIRVQSAASSDSDTNPYTNSLILNNKVFVPQSGSDLDDDAIQVYEQAMPGYEIHGVYSSGWYNTDALHCRTHGIADREMLYIKHYPLQGELEFQWEYTIEAEVSSYGGSPISAGYPKLFFRENSGDWQEQIMTLENGNIYTSQIPVQDGENSVEYYITAENENNKMESHPLIGVADPHVFSYLGSNQLVASNTEICNGNSTGDMTLTNFSGTISDWERRLNNNSWESLGYSETTYSEIPETAGIWSYRVELDNSDYTAPVELTVVEEPISLFSWEDNNQEVAFLNLSENATAYQWSFGDGTTSAEPNPTHIYEAAGEYVVELLADNELCTEDAYSEILNIIYADIPSLSERRIQISPNPSSGRFKLQSDIKSGDIFIYSGSGQLIYSAQLKSSGNNVDISEVGSGVYLLESRTSEGLVRTKIIITK